LPVQIGVADLPQFFDDSPWFFDDSPRFFDDSPRVSSTHRVVAGLIYAQVAGESIPRECT